MRVLIVSVTTGQGHNATANTLAGEFKRRGQDAVIVDLYYYINRLIYKFMDKGYIFSTKHLSRQFGGAYTRLEKHEIMRRFVSFIGQNKQFARKFATYFKGYLPDVIITTHPLAANVLNELKKQLLIGIPVMGIVTDYCIHPFWEDVGSLEYIITASELISYSAEQKGLDRERLLPFGLPVRPEFSMRRDKAGVRRELSLSPEGKVVLVMGGSMGHGDMLGLVKEIDTISPDLQIVCICGRNEKLYRRMNLLRTKSALLVCDYVTNVYDYMDAADCIVTKPGGLTVTEVMAKRLPMILVNPIPGPEERNAEFLLNNGAAVMTGKHLSISEVLNYLFSTPKRMEIMKQAHEMISCPGAAERICVFAENLLKQPSETDTYVELGDEGIRSM